MVLPDKISPEPQDEISRSAALPVPADPATRRAAGTGLLGLINGVFAAIVGVYVATRSILITAIAGGAALLLAVLSLWKR